MKEIVLGSKRKYVVLLSEKGQPDRMQFTVNRLVNFQENEYEVVFALYDVIDSVLDLKDGESMYFQPNRDDKESKGIITRKDT